ncbi:MAG: hypothetical protein WC998_02820 [Candidatus Paceibacterota bacterium]|jgi:hypothetical protein
MKKTKHTKIFRFSKYEVPVTIELDDGNIINQVLYFIYDPKDKDIDNAINAVIARIENKVPEVSTTISFIDVEAILLKKGLIIQGETWIDFKAKDPIVPVAMKKETE